MDKDYRKAFKLHLMKVFAANKSDYNEKAEKSTTPDLVQTLFDTPSVVSRSRVIEALIDTPVQSARESFKSHDTGTNYYQYNPTTEDSAIATPPPKGQRMRGGDNTNTGIDNGPAISQENFSIYTCGSTNTSTCSSKTPSFRKRTARELSNMVLAECELVESLNLIESESSRQKQLNKEPILELPIVLWRSKREKFNSSIDLRFDDTPTASAMDQQQRQPQTPRLPTYEKNEQQTQRKDCQDSLIGEHDDCLYAEELIREQFTAPLIRHVERNYVRNITATADLLKILERMPADIDRVLAKQCNK